MAEFKVNRGLLRGTYFQHALVILSLLTSGMGTVQIGRTFSIAQIFVIILFFVGMINIFKLKKYFFNKFLITLNISIFFVSFVLNYQNFIGTSFIMMVGVFIYSSAYYWYVRQNQSNLIELVKLYLAFSFIIAIIGIIQEIGFLMGLRYLYDLSIYGIQSFNLTLSGPFLRINSVASEPAHLAFLLLPGCYFALLRLFKEKDIYNIINIRQSIIILIAMILTFSPVGYAGILLLLLFIAKGKGIKRFIQMLLLSISFGVVSFYLSLNINEKIIQIFTVEEQLTTSNLSTFALYSNALVAWESFRNSFFLGTGINTHVINYGKYIDLFFLRKNIVMELNTNDAGSLFLRVISEFGLVGIFLAIWLLVHFKIRHNTNKLIYVNNMALVGILGYSIRAGNYLDTFFWLMVTIYICSFVQNKYTNRSISNEKLSIS